MIICITENSTKFDNFGKPYLLDTSLLKEEYLRSYLEVARNVVVISLEDSKFITSYNRENLWNAMVQPPQMVDKLLSIIFT